MTAPLPTWVTDLVAAIERSEDEHPTYYGDFYNGIHKLDKCPQQEFLALIPADVRAATSAASSRAQAARLLIRMLEKDGEPVPDDLRAIAGEQP